MQAQPYRRPASDRARISVFAAAMVFALATTGASRAQTTTDTDGDGLPDNWEISQFGNLNQGPLDDPDHDGLANLLEWKLGLDPNTADFAGRPGQLYVERWDGISGASVDSLTPSLHFHELPDQVSFVSSAETPANAGESYGLRVRGCVIAPVTGNYRFYLAADDAAQLWLGNSASKFTRTRIASVSAYTGLRQWTKYPEQTSAAIHLVAGRKYYLEALMKENTGSDNLSIGWTYTDDSGSTAGQPAVTVIPGRLADANNTVVLESYTPDPNDRDDDGLPDDWELRSGLNPGDNGRINPADGSYADPDGDGFNNLQEYQTGGDPFVAGGNAGYVQRDIWTGITGNNVSNLTSSANFAKPANDSSFISSNLDFGSYGDNYGQRVRGSIVPPRSGTWRFWIAGDNAAEFWLSGNWQATGKRKAAYLTSYVPAKAYDVTPSQKSAVVNLTQDTPYYFEILHKEGSGSAHVSVAWAYDSPDWALASNGSTATQSGTYSTGVASRAIDGNTNGAWSANSVTHTPNSQNSWLQVDFGQTRPLTRVVLWNRTDTGTGGRLSNFRISALDANGAEVAGQNFYPPGTGNVGASMTWDLPQKVQARKVKVSLNGLNNLGDGYLSLAEVQCFEWYPETVRTVVPASALRTQTLDPADSDNDSLPDWWERQYALDASDNGSVRAANGEYGDPDGDGIPNLLEYINGTAPTSPNGEVGKLTRETWWNLPGGTVYELEHAPRYLQPADLKDTLSAWLYSSRGDYYGERLRGILTAPETGWYTFWIAGDNECRLSLSTDDRKFRKRKIASVGDGGFDFSGLATGAGSTDGNYDKYPSQRSQPVYLTAGGRYFLEVLHKDDFSADHVSVAWKLPSSSTRAAVPFAALRSFVYDIDDTDDDDLPDSWESAYHLDPADNGAVNPGEGALGDMDGDGLTNREEYLLGTDPTRADTDGDRISDFDEVRCLGSDPLSADSGFTGNPQVLDNSAATAPTGEWFDGLTGGKDLRDRLGSLRYPFHLASAGVQGYDILAAAQGNAWAGPPITFDISVISPDGAHVWSCGSKPLADSPDAHVMGLLPWLAAGDYLLNLSVRNSSGTRSVRIDRVDILSAGGADADGNGIADWLDTRAAQANAITVAPAASAVSPACVEGTAEQLQDAAIGVKAANAPTGTPRTALTLNPGPDTLWYANVPLPADGSGLEIGGTFGAGSIMAAPQVMAWTPTNVFNGGTITVRAGDSLRLTAYPATGSPDGGAVSITGAGDDITTTANAPVIRTFTLPTDWALASNGSTATQSGTYSSGVASRAIDGNTNGAWSANSVTHTTNAENSWWQVDFGRTRDVGRIVLWNRTDSGEGVRLSNFHIAVLDANGVEVTGQDFFPTGNAGTTLVWDLPQTVRANRVRVSLNGLNNQGTGYLSLAEVQVFPANPYVLHASYTDVNGVSSTGTMTVNVVAPDFGPAFEVRQDRWRTWTLAGIPAGLQFQADHDLQVAETTVAGQTGRTLNVSATTAGTMRILARTTPGGSVAACGTVKSYVVGDVYDTGYIEVLETLADGTVRGRITVTADQLPPGGYVELDIWAGGAQFADGSTVMRLYAADFPANGVANIDVYYPSAGAVSSFCHYTRLYDGSGRLLSSY